MTQDQVGQIMMAANLISQLVPVATTLVDGLRNIAKESDVPPETYAALDAEIDRRQAANRQEIANHPAAPTGD